MGCMRANMGWAMRAIDLCLSRFWPAFSTTKDLDAEHELPLFEKCFHGDSDTATGECRVLVPSEAVGLGVVHVFVELLTGGKVLVVSM